MFDLSGPVFPDFPDFQRIFGALGRAYREGFAVEFGRIFIWFMRFPGVSPGFDLGSTCVRPERTCVPGFSRILREDFRLREGLFGRILWSEAVGYS